MSNSIISSMESLEIDPLANVAHEGPELLLEPHQDAPPALAQDEPPTNVELGTLRDLQQRTAEAHRGGVT